MNQSIPPAPSPSPGLRRGIYPPCQSRGMGHLQILHCPGVGHLPTPGPFPRLPSRIKLHRRFYRKKKKQIGSSVKDRNKLKRVVKACSLFHACISSLLIKSELHHEIGAIAEVNLRFLVIEEHPFIFIKLFITYNFTALY